MTQEKSGLRKKVLFVITKSNFGGAQRYVLELAAHVPVGYEAVVAFGGAGNGTGGPGVLAQLLANAGVRTIFISELTRDVSLADFAALRALERVFRAERPDIVHLNSSKAGGLGAWAARRTGVPKIIFTSHGLAYDEPRGLFARTAIFFATWATFSFCHAVICISANTAERARRLLLVRGKVHLVYNGIEEPSFLEKAEARAILARKGAIDTVIPWVGTIAELTANKGLSYLIKAAYQLKKSGRRAAVVVIGEGDRRRDLEMQIRELGLEREVHLVGYVANARDYLRAFDIFALPSLKEGLPYVLLEAGWAGLPVVASNISGIDDIISESAGVLVPRKHPHALARAIGDLLDDPKQCEALGATLKERMQTTFSTERMLADTFAIYQ